MQQLRLPVARKSNHHIDEEKYLNKEEVVTAVGSLHQLQDLLSEIDAGLQRGDVAGVEAVWASIIMDRAEKILRPAVAFAAGTWHESN